MGVRCIVMKMFVIICCVKCDRSRIEHRIKQLTEVLMHELQVSPERSIRGGPRSARRAVAQLIRLGKSVQVTAKALYLCPTFDYALIVE